MKATINKLKVKNLQMQREILKEDIKDLDTEIKTLKNKSYFFGFYREKISPLIEQKQVLISKLGNLKLKCRGE